jgi:hypothetical protein
MKLILISILSIVCLNPIISQTTSNFSHPLQIEPVAIYNKARVTGTYWDKKQLGVYEQYRNLQLEGELNFWNDFSVISSIGKTNYIITDSEPENSFDRLNLGLKYGKIFNLGSSQLLVGGSMKFFNKKLDGELKSRENPDYFLMRPNFGLGYKSGRFEIMSEFRFQTETNRNLKEGSLDEFRRYYQFGIAPSWAITPQVRVFTELEYREPYDKVIDTKTRFFNFYPGFSYNTQEFGTFSVSLQLSILSRDENAMDRGLRLSYFYFFDTAKNQDSMKKISP